MRAIRTLVVGISFVVSSLFAFAPAHAQVDVDVSIDVAPPPLPVYDQPPIPEPGYLWAPGYWAWDDDVGYYWVPGTWVLPPEPDLLWTPGYWGWNDGVYGFHAGYWGPHIGFMAAWRMASAIPGPVMKAAIGATARSSITALSTTSAACGSPTSITRRLL